MTIYFEYDIVNKRDCEKVFFLCENSHKNKRNTPFYKEETRDYAHGGGHIMRTRITLACTECKNRNYDTTKDKKTHPDRMETKKYCKFCKTHTLHKETK